MLICNVHRCSVVEHFGQRKLSNRFSIGGNWQRASSMVTTFHCVVEATNAESPETCANNRQVFAASTNLNESKPAMIVKRSLLDVSLSVPGMKNGGHHCFGETCLY
ncbi:hypothetical protein K0M31_013536 [Melipona bicolor]|uniref:Uncharacterized protein n=1 Tax=Melipona bicolor TaxID=60889 RepID=A0AA40FI65_9HYME|nr:hypothetical protein K0M31_013536 [Melipona bicolor]